MHALPTKNEEEGGEHRRPTHQDVISRDEARRR